ncbi:hypothetical protein B0H10DRAFT_2210879 [Mycena sp. CBHHK59/15]|nr:hypothetical protein B0H10DRAFT_2210879 [Mycena sp. CBHHK59/15]
MARPREPLRVNIPPSINSQQPMPFDRGQPMFSPALPTALQQGMFPQFPLRTPLQPFFNPPPPGAPGRPTHRQGSASIANFTPSALQSSFPMTPRGGHFPHPSLMLAPGQPFPGPSGGGPPFLNRNRRQPSIGGPPKAVLGGPARKHSPLPPIAAAAPPAPPQKVRKSVVKLPKESPVGEGGQPAEKPAWARTPLETPFVYKEVQVVEAELTTAEPFPTDSWRYTMPPTVDVFLPGKRAWQDIKKREIDEKLERLGVERATNGHIHAPHARAASISSPADPALLFFKLNKLQQSQTVSSNNSLSTSPQPPPFGLSPSPHHQPPPRFLTNRHGYSMSLAQPPTYRSPSAGSSSFGGPTHNPFGPHAFLGSDQRSLPGDLDPESDAEPIHAPQGRVPLTMPSLVPPALSLGRPDSRPDFMRGFGLDATEEEDETEEEGEDDDRLLANDEGTADGEDSNEDGDGVRTARHSRHVSRLSGALSLRSVGGVVSEGLNASMHDRTDPAPGDASQDMDLDNEVAAEWTGSEDQYNDHETSEDESIGDWSNPSDEEHARQQRVERRMRRRMDDQPRRVPNFPRPPDNTIIVPRPRDEEIISNPSEEEERLHHPEYLGVVDPNAYYTGSPSGRSPRPLPALPHSRATSGNFTAHDPAQAHSRLPSDNFVYPQPQQQALSPAPRRDSLNPYAKPFVFGAPVEQFVFGAANGAATPSNPWSGHRAVSPLNAPLITHSRLPSIATALNPAAQEFKPSGFTFRPPAGVPHVAFPEPEPAVAMPTAESTPYKTQGREKRQRRSLSVGSAEEGDSMSSFRFPPNADSPASMRRPAPPSTAHSSLNPSAEPFTFAGFTAAVARDTVPLLPSLMPMSPGAEDTLHDESVDTAKADGKDDKEPNEREFALPVGRPKRAPIPLDFTRSHAASPSTQLDFRSGTTVPAGLFKALANGGDERTRRTVRSRLSSRDVFDHSHRPSLDDRNVPPISGTRSRLVTDPGSRRDDGDVFGASVRRHGHGRRRSSLPDALRDATNTSVSEEDESTPAMDLTSRMEMHQYEQRLEALLDEKFDGLRRDVVRAKGSLSPSAEAAITEVVQLFRSQLQDSVARGLEDSHMDARGELDFELIKDAVQQGHAEARAVLKRELADMGLRAAQGRAPVDAVESLAPVMHELNNRTVNAVTEAISELSVRLEAISVAAPARERDSMVDALMSALSPVLSSLHPEPVDYDYLTDKLTQAVKPHISQLIDLASDKRETAGLIVDRILPLLPSQKSLKVDTDAIAQRLCAEVRHAIAPIDAFEIKEQVADLVVERLDSRLAVRDRALNADTIASKVTDGVTQLLTPMKQVTDDLTILLEGQQSLSSQQTDLSSTHKKVVDLMSELPPRLISAIEALNAAQANVPKANGVVPDSRSDEHVLHIKSVVEDLAGGQRAISANSSSLLSLHKEVLEQLGALPESFAAATNVLQGVHAEFALTRDSTKREMDELRRTNTEHQIQLAKARGAHGQVRVEKEVVSEKLSIVEADRDRLRAQFKELQASTSAKALDLTAVEARNSELEDALAKALARLQASDVATQTNQERILELEKVNRELASEKQTLKSKVDSLDLQATFAARDKESALQALAALQKQHDHLTSQQSHWDDLRHASGQIEMLTNLIGQADNEELKDLRHVRDRAKVLEGEHAALLKRFKDQENKVANSEKAALTARQSLAQAQQRSAEWEKRAKEYEGQLEMTQTKLDQAEQTQSQLDADYSLVKLQLEEREADERLTKDRDNKFRDQIAALEAKVNQLQIELDRSRAKTPTKVAPAAPATPYRSITNGSMHRPDSRTSTVYPSRPPSPSARSVTPPHPSVWDSMHAPRGPNGTHNSSAASMHAPKVHTPTPASRYSSMGPARRPPSQAYSRYSQARAAPPTPPSPTPSTVSLAPTQGPDGWWQ